jgi:hypothetical protein
MGILNDAHGFPRWDPTVKGNEGRVPECERLRLHVHQFAVASKKNFNPVIAALNEIGEMP